MNKLIALVSFGLGFLAIFPVYRYFYNAVISNGREYDKAYTQEYDKDATEAFTEDLLQRKRGSEYDNVQKFVYASLAAFIVPITLNIFIACGIYLLFVWMLQIAAWVW